MATRRRFEQIGGGGVGTPGGPQSVTAIVNTAVAEAVAGLSFTSTANQINGFPCSSTVSVGDWVTVSGGVAVKASASSPASAFLLGVVDSKNSATSANIITGGITGEIFSGLDTTKPYYLSASSGGMTTTQPTGYGQVVLPLGQPITPTRFLVRMGQLMVRAS
jgi:hypothetical protein